MNQRRSGAGLLQRLQLLAGLEAHGLSWGNRNLRAGARIAPDAGLARFDVEDAETPQFDAVALFESFLHRLEYGLHRHFGLRFRDAGPVDDLVDDVQLDQNASSNPLGAPARHSAGPIHASFN